MNIDQQDILLLKQRETEFANLAESCSRSELAKCAKFLAMHLALYRQRFGELSATDFSRLLLQPELDRELLQILDEGLHEASEMMKLILQQGGGREQPAAADDKLH